MIRPPEVDKVVTSLKRLLGKVQTREILTVLDLNSEASAEEIDRAFKETFIPRYHPDRFAGYNDKEIKELTNTLFASTKKAVERLKQDAIRSANMVNSIKEKAKEKPPIEPTKDGTTNPIQQIALGHKPGRKAKDNQSRSKQPPPSKKIHPRPSRVDKGKATGDTVPLYTIKEEKRNKKQDSPLKKHGSPRSGTKDTNDTSRRRTAMGSSFRGNPVQEAVRGRALLRKKDYAGAAQCFARAAYLEKKSAEYKALLGWAMFMEDHSKKREAKALLEKACKLDDDYYLPLYYLGMIFKIEGDLKKALEFFEKSKALNPRNPDVNAELRAAQRKQSIKASPGKKTERSKKRGGTPSGGILSKFFRKKPDSD
ncbi:MAG: hypothetical protein GXP49_11635 [Deltaproteobacteria bacterium]|nr:hypothetical protein [Deltaproteobacteria bacterium]